MDRRSFFKYASFSGAMTAFLGGLHPALALTWQKIGTTSGGGATKVRLPRKPYRMLGGGVIAAGVRHSLALRSDGLVFASGNNNLGQLGNNSIVDKLTYVQALGVSNVVALAAGVRHSLALRSDGLVFACGYNYWGQLGNNSTVRESTYVQAVSP